MALEHWDEAFFSRLGNAAQLGALLDALPTAFFFAKDVEGHFTAVNRAWLGALGIADGESVLGRTDYDYFDKDLADAYRDEDRRVMESGVPVLHELWWVPNVATGDIHWYRSTKVPLWGPEGESVGIAGMMREVVDSAELTAEHHQMTKVARHVEKHFAEKLTVADLAKVAGLSARQFQRIFKRVFRTGPIEYLGRVRVRVAAARLLEGDDSLSEIAIDCGFYDQSHFTNQFRRYRGMAPSKYRKEFGG